MVCDNMHAVFFALPNIMPSRSYGVVASSSGGQGFGGSYVMSAVNGPLTHKYPTSMPAHNSGVLYGKFPTPMQFHPGQTPTDSNMGTIQRHEYIRTTGGLPPSATKFIQPVDSSAYTAFNKRTAIGLASFSQSGPFSTKAYDINLTKSRLHRVRNTGSVAPKKKGAYYL